MIASALSSLGIFITTIGVYLAYKNSPINERIDASYVGPSDEELNIRNQKLRSSIKIVIAGSTIQFLASLVMFFEPGKS